MLRAFFVQRASVQGNHMGFAPSVESQDKEYFVTTSTPSSLVSWPLLDEVSGGPRHGCHGVGTNTPQGTWGLGCGNPLPQVSTYDSRGHGTCGRMAGAAGGGGAWQQWISFSCAFLLCLVSVSFSLGPTHSTTLYPPRHLRLLHLHFPFHAHLLTFLFLVPHFAANFWTEL